MSIEIGRIYSHKTTGARVKVRDIKEAVGARYNFIYYTEMDLTSTVIYQLKLPEDTFTKRYLPEEMGAIDGSN